MGEILPFRRVIAPTIQQTYAKSFYDPNTGISWKTVTDWWDSQPEGPADYDSRLGQWVSQRCVKLGDGETFYPVHFSRQGQA